MRLGRRRPSTVEFFMGLHAQYRRWLLSTPGGHLDAEEVELIYSSTFCLLTDIIGPLLGMASNEDFDVVAEGLEDTWKEVLKDIRHSFNRTRMDRKSP